MSCLDHINQTETDPELFERNAWLTRVKKWFIQSADGEGDVRNMSESIHLIRGLYITVKEVIRNPGKRRGTLVLSPAPGIDPVTSGLATQRNGGLLAEFDRKATYVEGLFGGVVPKALQLMVTLCALMLPNDYTDMGSALWRQCLDGHDTQVIQPVSAFFLFWCTIPHVIRHVF